MRNAREIPELAIKSSNHLTLYALPTIDRSRSAPYKLDWPKEGGECHEDDSAGCRM